MTIPVSEIITLTLTGDRAIDIPLWCMYQSYATLYFQNKENPDE